MKYTLVLALALTVPLPLAAERVLLPLFVRMIPGAGGSQFTTTLTIHNAGSVHVPIEGIIVSCPIPTCPPAEPPIAGLAPGFTRSDFERTDGMERALPARVIHIPAGAPLEANLTARDLSRQLETQGTELPIVREAEFRIEPTNLVGITVADRFRHTLRIYAFEPTVAAVKVWRIRSGAADALLKERTVVLDGVIDRYTPAYVQLSDLVTHEEGTAGLFNAIRIEVTPLTSDTPLWAFASVTHNETQHITTITPQMMTAD
jgi:hypothetical protein